MPKKASSRILRFFLQDPLDTGTGFKAENVSIMEAMLAQNRDDSSPESIIKEYIEACRVGSVDRLRAIFHPEALMAGYFQGEFYIGSPKPFFEEVRDNPSPSESGASYSGEIATIEICGNVASVSMKESGYLVLSFTNWFHLARLDGSWKIISKSYQSE